MNISIYTSWPCHSLIGKFGTSAALLEATNDKTDADKTEVDKTGVDKNIDFLTFERDKNLRKSNWPVDLLSLKGVNKHDPALGLECVLAIWTRIDSRGSGSVKFHILISVAGPTYNLQAIYSILHELD